MKKLIPTILILITAAFDLPAQERLTPEEMFRWFPAGKYDAVSHHDLAIASKQPGFQIYFAGGRNSVKGWINSPPMPEELLDKFDSVTTMTTVRIVAYNSQEPRPMGRGGKISSEEIAGKNYFSNSFGFQMVVVRPDHNLELKKLLPGFKSVELIGQTIKEGSVYNFKSSRYRGKEITYYLWLSPEDELLVCEELKLLKKMISAGYGEEPGILADFPYPALLDALPDIGPGWTYASFKPAYKAICMQAEKDGIDTEEIKTHGLKRRKRGDILMDVLFANPPQLRFISVFDKEEDAKEYLAIRNRPRPESKDINDFDRTVNKFTVSSRQRNMVISARIHTPEYIEADNKRRQYWREQSEKRKAEAAKNKAEEAKKTSKGETK